MQTSIIATALMAFAAVANGHITMKNPVPFGSVGPNKSLTTSPLTSSNFPCQVSGDPATFYSKEGLDNTMVIGQPQTISFSGSAVHGGGSCQLALTKDLQPSASTSWMTILSIEGGCPSKTGTGTDEYQFTIPDGIAPGDYVFAWTWISKLSGTQEYYMNCAPVSITGGSGKRDVYHNETMELYARDAQFPELMVANLNGINDCKSELSTDPTYPVPGSNVMKPGSNNAFAPINGSNCVPKGAKQVAPGTGSGSGSGSGSSAAAPATSSAPATSAAVATSSAAATPTSSSAAETSECDASSTDAAQTPSSTATPSSFITLTITPPGSSAAATPTATMSSSSSALVPTSSFPSTPTSSSAPNTGGQGLTGACSTEGMFNCIGGTSYQQCASGSWSTVIAMPPTTKCAEGQTMTLWARNEVNYRRNSFLARRRA